MASIKAQQVALAVTPMITGSISSIASLSIIVSILRSDLKLSTSYRRLVFGISVFDLIQSISQANSSLPMPVGTFWLASGNGITCSLQGFTTVVGFTATVLYSLSLTFYFLLVVKYDVDDAKIAKYVEPILHAVPILFSSIASVYALATNNYNVDGPTCTINSKPLNCYDDPDIDCISKENPNTLRLIIAGLMIIVFFSNCIMMVMIWLSVYSQIKKSQTYRYSWISSLNPSQNRSEEEEGEPSTHNSLRATWKSRLSGIFSYRQEDQTLSPLAARLSRPSQASVRRIRETSNRALAYIVGFLLTYIFFFIRRSIEAGSGNSAPFAIVILTRFFYPLQGLFNVIVYTYPHVVSYRRNHTEYSWPRAFWEVVKNGDDSDEVQLTPTRRRSLGRQQQALASMNSKKKKKKGRRNSSSANIESTSRTASSPIGPTMSSPTQRRAPSIADFNNNSKSAAIDVCIAHKEDSECIADALEGSRNNSLFPIASSSLMELDSSSEQKVLDDDGFKYDSGGLPSGIDEEKQEIVADSHTKRCLDFK